MEIAYLPTNTEVGLTAPFNYAAPDFNPSGNTAAATGAAFTNAKLTGGNLPFDPDANFLLKLHIGVHVHVGDTWWKSGRNSNSR